MYRENPRYNDQERLDILQIPKRTYDRYKSRIWREDGPKKRTRKATRNESEDGRPLHIGKYTGISEASRKHQK